MFKFNRRYDSSLNMKQQEVISIANFKILRCISPLFSEDVLYLYPCKINVEPAAAALFLIFPC